MNCCCILLNIEIQPVTMAKPEIGRAPSVYSYQWYLTPEIDKVTGFCYYTFNVDGNDFTISWSNVDGSSWQILDSYGEVLYFFASDYVCPVSTLGDWFMTPAGWKLPLESLYISEVACENPVVDIPVIEVPSINCDESFSCKFVNLLKKQKASLAVDVASNRNHEMFGLKGCEDNWNNLFMRYLIIDALECVPQGVYSDATENCLIGKLTENCNC